MGKKRIAIIGFGNVAKSAVVAVSESPDLELAGIVIRDYKKIEIVKKEVGDAPVVTDIDELGEVKVALLCVASRAIPEIAPKYLAKGINTVDSFDIHGESLLKLKKNLDNIAKDKNCVSVISAGWDPGTDSMVRAIMEIIAPQGITYTNFGPGMSMGHTVAVKAIEGIEDALSITVPKGTGLHKRLVYVKIKQGYNFADIEKAIKNDPYFIHDETYVYKVDDVQNLIDMGHGVSIERKGVSGKIHNQRMEFSMSLNNPAATAQVMVSAARASLKQKPGCYTLLEIPLIDFLYGDIEKKLILMV